MCVEFEWTSKFAKEYIEGGECTVGVGSMVCFVPKYTRGRKNNVLKILV